MDPAAAQKIHPHDTKRIIRALEVSRIGGRPISELHKKRSGLWGKYPIKIIALNRPRPELYDRINNRVDQMFEDGLVDEIKSLLTKPWGLTARGIIGYKEIKGFLDGEYHIDIAKNLMKLHTRHFAKRQLTWFRRDKRLDWVMITPRDTPAGVADKIKENYGKSFIGHR